MVTQVNPRQTTLYTADTDIWRYHDGTYGPDKTKAHSLVCRAGGLVPTDIAHKIVAASTPVEVVEVKEEPTKKEEAVPNLIAKPEKKVSN